MENQIVKTFSSEQFGEIRTVTKDGEVWFCLADICRVLELSNPSKVKSRLDDDDTQLVDLHALTFGYGTVIGNSMVTFVNESGLYTVVIRSNSELAKPFRRWVTKEVLPEIRRTGQYGGTPSLPTPQTYIEALRRLADEVEERERQKALVEEMKPRAELGRAIEECDDTCLVAELAKILKQSGVNIGQNRMFEQLREWGYLGKDGQYRNQPTQKSMDLGLFRIKKTVVTLPNSMTRTTITPMVTGKGQVYLFNKFKDEYTVRGKRHKKKSLTLRERMERDCPETLRIADEGRARFPGPVVELRKQIEKESRRA